MILCNISKVEIFERPAMFLFSLWLIGKPQVSSLDVSKKEIQHSMNGSKLAIISAELTSRSRDDSCWYMRVEVTKWNWIFFQLKDQSRIGIRMSPEDEVVAIVTDKCWRCSCQIQIYSKWASQPLVLQHVLRPEVEVFLSINFTNCSRGINLKNFGISIKIRFDLSTKRVLYLKWASSDWYKFFTFLFWDFSKVLSWHLR